MFGISNGELIVIFLIILTVVGPKRLPQIARVIGRILRYFKDGFQELNDAIEDEAPQEIKDEIRRLFSDKDTNI
ncbi:MAG: twin-arginine translocase TatA/TatE family subunit [Candidatus Omnitrophica bacterium]|nr:twin-arginine translocase TatA/TatE family subunit [Candidatus Omnitrophota bacterium]MCM8826562.1 twin-arginine translocase TatA/TatE family subunit [Candidatus Omnitrophota bacterium]